MLRRIGATALIVLAVAMAHGAGLTRPAQNWLEEARFDAMSREASGQIVFVEIDPRSLDRIGVWPWPRSLHAHAVNELLKAGAAEITFDVDFSAASSEPQDMAFERALEAAAGIVALPTFRQAWSSTDGRATQHVNEPLPRFAQHSWAVSVNVFADPDGAVRTLRVGDTIDGEFRPSIAALYGGFPGGLGATFGVDFSIDPNTVPRLSFIDVMSGDIPDGSVEGRKVLIGAAAAELRDHFAVPSHGIMSGPMLQIIGAESIMQGRALSRASMAATLMLLIAVAALSLLLRRYFQWKVHLVALAGAALLAEALAFLVQSSAPLVIETAPLHVLAVVLGAVAVASEVDLRGFLLRVAHAETRAARDMLDQVVADNFDGIVVIDAGGAVVSANGAALRILRRDAASPAVGEQYGEVLPDALTGQVRETFDRFDAGEAEHGEPAELECTLGGAPVVLESLATPSRIGDVEQVRRGQAGQEQTVVCLTFRDVTERTRERAQIDYMAHYDGLTGLANRNRFLAVLEEMLAEAQAYGRRIAVIYFDLDRFKGVNDTLGHYYGDLLLNEIASRADQVCPDDGIAARFGGDEFVLAMSLDDAGQACALADRLLESLREPYHLQGHRVIVGASAGIALSDDGSTDAGELIRGADAALHRAKGDGGNRHSVYEPEFGERLRVRREIELDLWKAFERGEFEVHYQPQVDLTTGVLNGAEALLRWKCPQRGYVSPVEFIPVAEDIGLIAELGAWTLATSCADAATWPMPIKVAVNVSAHQFRTGDLLASVDRAVAKSGIGDGRLDIEITESLLADESPVTASILAALRERGLGLALDDFGTGYSSLSYIQRFPITKIKIDRAFVRGLPDDTGGLAIVRAVTALSSSLQLATTAEGIETVDQATMIRLAGCGQGQGYLYSRPLPADEFLEFVARCDRGVPLVA